VTNPDDEGSPPVAGVKVTFQIAGAGGAQTAVATTGSHGRASADPVVTLPPGDYNVTISTARLGKHAATSITVPVRVPTAAERIKDLDKRVKNAGLPAGTEHSLRQKLEHAHERLTQGKVVAACNSLAAFMNQVRALRGQKIPASKARQFIADARSIRHQLHCPPANH
jgi:phosphatidate phosphatase APP1